MALGHHGLKSWWGYERTLFDSAKNPWISIFDHSIVAYIHEVVRRDIKFKRRSSWVGIATLHGVLGMGLILQTQPQMFIIGQKRTTHQRTPKPPIRPHIGPYRSRAPPSDISSHSRFRHLRCPITTLDSSRPPSLIRAACTLQEVSTWFPVRQRCRTYNLSGEFRSMSGLANSFIPSNQMISHIYVRLLRHLLRAGL